MSKLLESTKIADEIKDIFRFDEYGGFSDFDVEQNSDEESWDVSFKLIGVPLELTIRPIGEGEVDRFEYHVYDDTWEEFKSFDYTAAKPVLHLLFELCGQIKRLKKDV